ncbi:cysteine--tRNA ligase [Puniceicoccaceae bacterium K14]|nr:cysteine--tRNA ligase [Puniceicoccaceae bacterium K14]
MTPVTFHNTLSRQNEAIQPTKGNVIGMYCCGPTVYAQAHIGNFRTFLAQDVMRRTIQTAGYKVIHVRNLTDVDDKTIAKSVAEAKPLREVTEHWTEVFHDDCERLNLLKPQIEPKATEHIPEQTSMIESLIEKENAYATEDGSVYFRVSSFPEYGALSRVKDRELTTDAASDTPNDSDEYERDSMADFVLWKSRKPTDGDVYWDSPWGQGRPGWHLECSAMSMKYLSNNLDIHSGGVDLTFPHHDNEIAQSECSCGHKFFKHWIHCAHLLVDGGKMSKSLNNFYTVDDILKKGYQPVVLRYALTSGHYRQTINFTLDSLNAAQSALTRLKKFSDDILAATSLKRSTLLKSIDKGKQTKAPWAKFQKAWDQLSNDLNIAGALGAIFTAIKEINSTELSNEEAAENAIAFHKLVYALGYDLDSVVIEKPKIEAPEEIKALAQQRWEAKQAKDWTAADQFRAQLQEKGWLVKDTKDSYEIETI